MALLRVEEIDVRFGGVHALSGVSLEVEPGRVTGLIGPNGAGKTTLFNAICGLQPVHAGRVLFDGDDISGLRAHRRARLGIGRTFQRLEVFGSLTVRENVLTAAEIRKGWSRDGSDPSTVVEGLLERLRLGSLADERADALPTGLLRTVELGRAMAQKPRLLLLDEPSSGLSASESALLSGLLEEIAKEGLGILLVEHHVEMVMEVCADIYVLDFGRIIASGPPKQIAADEAVQRAYLGRGDHDAA